MLKHITLKYAEEGNALVMRVCEYRGKGGVITVDLPEAIRSASRVNLLEQELSALEISDGRIGLQLRPWEIASVRLEL